MSRVSRAISTMWAGLPPTSAMPSCREQMLKGMCTGGKHCLAPARLLPPAGGPQRLSEHPAPDAGAAGVKKVFIRSGIRFDYLMADPDDTFFKELVEHHVSGQLKVAPEHCAPNTLAYMGKPPLMCSISSRTSSTS